MQYTKENIIQCDNGTFELSLYPIGEPTETTLNRAIDRLKVAFPYQNSQFFELLKERVIFHKFSDERLRDAIDNIIDNYTYKTLTIANIISYNKTIPLYTMRQKVAIVNSYTMERRQPPQFEVVTIDNTAYYKQI